MLWYLSIAPETAPMRYSVRNDQWYPLFSLFLYQLLKEEKTATKILPLHFKILILDIFLMAFSTAIHFLVHMCGVYMFIPICAGVQTALGIHAGEDQRSVSSVFMVPHVFFFFCLSVNPEVIHLARRDGQWAQEFACLPFLSTEITDMCWCVVLLSLALWGCCGQKLGPSCVYTRHFPEPSSLAPSVPVARWWKDAHLNADTGRQKGESTEHLIS